MEAWRRVLCLAAILPILWPIGDALGASISGRASTVLEWYDTPQEETAVPFYQYLLLNVEDLDSRGTAFRLYGRVGDDLNGKVDADSRLYHAFLDMSNLLTGLDLRLGRQFITTTAGASVMDGLKADYRFAGNYRFSLFGGGDVKYYEGYNADDLIVGGEIGARFMDRLNLNLSYITKWEDSDTTHELIGLHVDYNIPRLINLYSELQYNWQRDSVSYFLAGAKYYRSPVWSLRTEYLYSLPVFSSTSIYSVFAVNEYQEIMGELTYRLRPDVHTFLRYTREIYQEFSDADVVELGLQKLRTDRFSGYLVGTWREDSDGQDMRGIKARVAYLFLPKFEAGIGAHIDVLERRIDDTDETTASRIWTDATYSISQRTELQAKVERVESDRWDHYYQGRVRLNIYF
jgi:hypothetical protein